MDMKKIILLILALVLTFAVLGQAKIITNKKLIIKHGDITLFLSNDTSTLVSPNFNKFNEK